MSASTIDCSTTTDHGRLRGTIGLGVLVLAGALLVAMAWSTVRVVWFVETSDFCEQQTCTRAAAEQAWARGGDALDALIAGEDAMEASGMGAFEFTFVYLPLTAVTMGGAGGARGWSVAAMVGRRS